MAQVADRLPHVAVFISSPKDVGNEREIVKRAIQEINADPAWKSRCVVRALAFEDLTPSQMGKPAQRVVDDFMRKSREADIVVCILRSRLGTPTLDEATGRQYLSGTHYEFETALDAFKKSPRETPRVMLFLGSCSCADDSSEEAFEQFTAARKFKKDIREKKEYEGLYFEYDEISQFEDLVRRHIRLHLEQVVAGAQGPGPVIVDGLALRHQARAYFSQLVENYRWLELQGIREAGSLRIELEKVYVALKAEPESEYDFQQASNLHAIEVSEAAGVDSTDVISSNELEELDALNIRRTYRPVRELAKRALITDVRTLGDAFRQHSRVVILGGPGSGKTTMGRWLVLQLAQFGLRALDHDAPQQVVVPVSQVNPDADLSGNETMDLGPSRLPIFLRLAHYARELAQREKQQTGSLPLIEYLGLDPDSCSLRDGLSAEARNTLFRAYLGEGEAVVILDGLDELSESNRRAVVLQVQNFIEKHIPVVIPGQIEGQPWKAGGNQIIVTSRYVGYKFAAVQAHCAHFGIQPMRRPAVERFARAWTEAVNAKLSEEGSDGISASRLITEIYDPTRPRVRELATNPLLVTILATVYWREGRLPEQRAGLYDRVVENLLEIWLKREECRQKLTREELLAALEPLAADLQENSGGNGLVSLARIGELAEGPLAHMSGISPSDRRFRPRLEALLSTIRKHVGLLAQQSAGNYAFFHRTFQEFLAARHLLAERSAAAQKIGDRIDDPNWREPLLLALEFVMIDPGWGPEQRSRLLSDVLALDASSALIPRAAMLLAAVLLEMRGAPPAVVEKIAVQLLTSYAISLEQIQGRGLTEQIEQLFVRVRQGAQAHNVAQLVTSLIQRPSDKHDLACAAATIVRRIDWFSTEMIEALLHAAHRDRPDLGWPIYRALLAAFGQQPSGSSWLNSAPARSVARLLNTHLSMRGLLESRPELVSLVRNDTDWLCLLIALYSGLEQRKSIEEIGQDQQQLVNAARTAAARIAVSMASQPAAPSSPASVVEFSPQFIVHDLADQDLSRIIQRQLVAGRSAVELAQVFRRRWQGGGGAGAADSLVGMAALGENVLPLLQADLASTDRQPIAQAAIARFRWLRAQLRSPLVQTTEAALRTIPENAPEGQQLDLLKIALTARIENGGAPLPVSGSVPEWNYVATSTPAARGALDAEYWTYLLSGANGGGSQKRPAVPVQLLWQPDRLLRAWSAVPNAVNRSAVDHIPWPQPVLAPPANTTVECYLAMLESMSSVPKEYHAVAGHALAQCRILLDEHPALLWETLAVCWCNGNEFTRGYRSFSDARPQRTLDIQNLLDAHLFAIGASTRQSGAMDSAKLLAELFNQAAALRDPYLRFRAQWRLLDMFVFERGDLELDLMELLPQIPDASNQLRALEWAFATIPRADIPLVDHLGLLIPLMETASRIAEPQSRALAQCRLALLNPKYLENLFRSAIESVGAIADAATKAATISEIRSVWGTTAGVSEALDRVAQTIAEPWQRHKALGQISRQLLVFRHQYAAELMRWRLPRDHSTGVRVFRQGRCAGSLPWAILYLSCAAAETEALGASIAGDSALWARLLDDDPEPAIAALKASAPKGGIAIKVREAAILERVADTPCVANLDSLWPYLVRPDPMTMGSVGRWLSRPGRMGQWSALVQAESGRLTPDVVSHVIDLLATSTDLLHLRTCLALHGPTPHTQNLQRRWMVRRIGAETLDVLARHASQTSYSPAAQSTMNWVHSDIHHDDRGAVERWVERAVSEGPSSPASWILQSMQSVNDDVIPPMISALRDAPPDTQRILLFGLARIAHCSKNIGRDAKVTAAIASVPIEVRKSVYVLPKTAVTFLEIAKAAADAAEPGYAPLQARQLLESSRVWLDDASLSSGGFSRLKEIGDQQYILLGGNSYWTTTNKAAEKLAQDPRILPILLSLLADADYAGPDGHNHHLIAAVEAMARVAPDTFAAVAPPEHWEPILTEWAQYADRWVARTAAVQLLGRLRRVTARVARGLRAAMDDVSFVQCAAYDSVGEFRRTDGDILPDLLPLLEDASAGTVAATARLLVSIARAGITSSDRRRVLQRLQWTVTRPSAARPVYLMDESNGEMSIRFVDNLDQILYRAIFEISGF